MNIVNVNFKNTIAWRACMRGTVTMWLSDIGIPPVVARNGERCWCGCEHASSPRRLIWKRSRAQKGLRLDHSIPLDQYNRNMAGKPTLFLWVSSLCRHTSGTILHRWPAWLKTSLCTSPPPSRTCGVLTFELTVARCRLICADLLCPRIKLVEELLRDVGCVPRHGNHGADACNARQLLVKRPRQRLRPYSFRNEKNWFRDLQSVHVVIYLSS